MRTRTSALALTALLLLAGFPGSGRGAGAGGDLFVDASAEAGLDFVHFNGMTGQLWLLEIMGSGAALFDYDNDGDLDVYLLQGHLLGPGKTMADAQRPPADDRALIDRLYRNDPVPGPDGSHSLRLVDVTEASGIVAPHYGMGAAVGDYDNDGWLDLYVTNFGSNQMFRNNGDGTFREVTAETGTDDKRWSVSATFFDFDGDGLLDLYVGNYVSFDFVLQPVCLMSTGAVDYCGPLAYEPDRDRLFRNRGDGTFEDRTAEAGLQQEFGAALGAIAADFNGDGRTDLYVANDMTPNQLWINRGDGSFQNDALLAGCAVNYEGKPEASMGVDAADFDGDGDEDLFMSHLTGETNTLYLNDGSGIFEDHTPVSGLGHASWNYTGFGTAWLDYDNDGWLDLLIVNGAVGNIEDLFLAGEPFPLHQPNQLFHNDGGGAFTEVTKQAGAAFEISEVSRGAAFGDLDNDGDADVLITNNAGPARLLLNRAGQESRWLGARPLAAGAPRPAIGARAALFRSDGRILWRRVRTDGSYASANDSRLLFGLGESAEAERLRVTWPGGRTSEWRRLPAGALVTLFERVR